MRCPVDSVEERGKNEQLAILDVLDVESADAGIASHGQDGCMIFKDPFLDHILQRNLNLQCAFSGAVEVPLEERSPGHHIQIPSPMLILKSGS
jgi:hypothetical protein